MVVSSGGEERSEMKSKSGAAHKLAFWPHKMLHNSHESCQNASSVLVLSPGSCGWPLVVWVGPRQGVKDLAPAHHLLLLLSTAFIILRISLSSMNQTYGFNSLVRKMLGVYPRLHSFRKRMLKYSRGVERVLLYGKCLACSKPETEIGAKIPRMLLSITT